MGRYHHRLVCSVPLSIEFRLSLTIAEPFKSPVIIKFDEGSELATIIWTLNDRLLKINQKTAIFHLLWDEAWLSLSQSSSSEFMLRRRRFLAPATRLGRRCTDRSFTLGRCREDERKRPEWLDEEDEELCLLGRFMCDLGGLAFSNGLRGLGNIWELAIWKPGSEQDKGLLLLVLLILEINAGLRVPVGRLPTTRPRGRRGAIETGRTTLTKGK